jgi:hypothetical protein
MTNFITICLCKPSLFLILYTSTLMMAAIYSSEKSVSISKTAQCHNPEDYDLKIT